MTEKKLVQGRVDKELKERLEHQLANHNLNTGNAVEAMVRLWLSLPTDLQLKLYHNSIGAEDFQSVIKTIVQSQLKASLSELTPEQRDQPLEDAKQARKKVRQMDRKKK